MRLLYFTDNNSGHNRRFLAKLSDSAHDVYYLSLAGTPPEGWVPPGIRVVPFSRSFPRRSPPSLLGSFVPEFRRILDNLRPDLVQAGAIQSCAYIAALAGFHPMLAMSWGSDILVDADINPEWTNATIVALKGADCLFCDSDAVREKAAEIEAGTVTDVVQFPWGIQRDVFGPDGDRVELPWSNDAFILISTRAWEPEYDVNVVLRAFVIAHQQLPLLRLLLMGHGSLEGEMRAFVRRHGLSESVMIRNDVVGIVWPTISAPRKHISRVPPPTEARFPCWKQWRPGYLPLWRTTHRIENGCERA